MYDAIFSGTPVNVPSPAGATVTSGIDKASGAEWVNVGAGWVPTSSAFAKSVALGASSTNASFLVVTAPTTGIYRVTGYVAQATSTAGTQSDLTVAWTEGDTSASLTATPVAATATTTVGQNTTGTLVINAKSGTSITVAIGTAPSAGTSNVKARIEFLG